MTNYHDDNFLLSICTTSRLQNEGKHNKITVKNKQINKKTRLINFKFTDSQGSAQMMPLNYACKLTFRQIDTQDH